MFSFKLDGKFFFSQSFLFHWLVTKCFSWRFSIFDSLIVLSKVNSTLMLPLSYCQNEKQSDWNSKVIYWPLEFITINVTAELKSHGLHCQAPLLINCLVSLSFPSNSSVIICVPCWLMVEFSKVNIWWHCFFKQLQHS